MSSNAKLIGFMLLIVTLVFAIQTLELNAKSDHDSIDKVAREAKLLAKNFKHDDTRIGMCRSLSESPNSENVTNCIEKAVESNNKDLALLHKIN